MARQIANISVDEYAVRALNEFIELKHGGKDECINIYKENVFVGGIAGGLYADYLIHWYSIFGDSIKVYFFEDLKNDPLSFMCELCNWLEIDPKIYSFRNFNIENRKITPRMKYLHNTALSINERFEGFLRSHYKMKTILKAIYCFFNETKRKDERFTESTSKQLESVYTRYNDRLIDILRSKGYSNFPYWLSHLNRNKIERVGIRLVTDKNCKETK
jgi:hypothetical protein